MAKSRLKVDRERSMVVTRTFSDEWTDDRTMAAGASVTWTHCSVLFEVTWGKTRRVRADASPSPPLPPLPPPSPSLPSTVRADAKK
jgi:hypothetical protein